MQYPVFMSSIHFYIRTLSRTHHFILSFVKLCTVFLLFSKMLILFSNVRVLYVLPAVSNVEWSFISAVGKS